MYADPRHIRAHRINLSVTDAERRAVEALAELNGTHPTVFVRDLLLDFLRCHEVNSVAQAPQLTGTH